MRQNPPTLPDDALRFLSALWGPGEVREIRIPQYDKYGSTASGYFDTPEALVAAAASWDGKANIYVTLNPVNPALLARANNRIAPKAKNTTSDEDVLGRHILFLDIDAERPSGISATSAELAAAHDLIMTVTRDLASAGWPAPIICLSGNGYYALYGIDLPNTDESKNLVERVLKALAARYDTPQATIDAGVANASRIACLIGTLKMKGDSIEERPHRRSQLLTKPEALVVVEEQQLRALADEVSPTQAIPRNAAFPAVGSRPLLDMLIEAGLDYREQAPDAHGILWYHLRECPFHGADHPYECGVGQRPDGAYTGKCFHRSEIGWQDWKQALGLTTRTTPHHQAMVTPASEAASPPRGREFPRTDAGNAELFAHLHGDEVRYDHRLHRYLLFGEGRWQQDGQTQVRILAKTTARHRLHLAAELADDAERQAEKKFARRSESKASLDAMLTLAQSEAPVSDDGEHWDENAMLLGVANGVLDLSSGMLRAGTPEDRMTLHTPILYDPDARCPRFERFLAEIFEGNVNLVEFAQRAVGYSLSGQTHEQAFFFCYGAGANGKGILFSVLRLLLGAYAQNLPFQSLELQSRGSIPNDIASIVNRRVVTVAETNRGVRLDEALLKTLTGEDVITARFMRKEYFNFVPVAKFWLAANHKPAVKDLSYGFWRRIMVIPFLRQFAKEERDPDLLERLKAELPGILVWAVRGCLVWQKRGLDPPEEVRAATEEYRLETDTVGRFIAKCCVLADTERCLGGRLYEAYRHWTKDEGVTEDDAVDKNTFAAALKERFHSKHTNTGNFYVGIGLPQQ